MTGKVLENLVAMELVRQLGWARTRGRLHRAASFRAGVVFYTGPQTLPLGDRLWAVPVSGLWTDRSG